MYLHLLIAIAAANVMPQFNYQCIPCVAFGGFYCFDDPWLVNFNGDRCYENAVDRVDCGQDFNFSSDASDCRGVVLVESANCNDFQQRFELFEEPNIDILLTMEPRSSCGISMLGFSSTMTTWHQYPLTMYHTLGAEQLSHTSTEALVRDKDSTCLNNECELEWGLTNVQHQFFIVNWDRNSEKNFTMRITENNAVLLGVSLVAMGL